MHDDFAVEMLPNLTVYNPETFRILGTGILLPPSLTAVVAEHDVILPAHCRSFRDHRPTTSPGKESPSFSHSYFYWPPHVLWPNAPLVFLFRLSYVSCNISNITDISVPSTNSSTTDCLPFFSPPLMLFLSVPLCLLHPSFLSHCFICCTPYKFVVTSLPSLPVPSHTLDHHTAPLTL